MKGRLTLYALAALLACGCNSAGDSGKKEATTKPDGVAPSPSGTEPPKSDAPPAGPDPSTLPASLRHQGFEWYGLGYGKPLKMTLTQDKTKMTGEQSFTLESLNNGVAVYKQSWSGELAGTMGESKYQLTEKGVFGLEAQGAKVDPPQLEIPASIATGFAWKSNGKIVLPTASVESVESKIVAIKPIKVAGRTVQALVVRRVSKLIFGGKPQTMETTEYYEKGVGAVKLEVTMKGSAPRSFTLEATP